MSIRQYDFKTRGPYCFRISGQIYRIFDRAAIPEDNCEPHGGQLFFVDTSEAISIRKNKLNVDPEDVEAIHNYLKTSNPYAKSYIMMREEMERQEEVACNINFTVLSSLL